MMGSGKSGGGKGGGGGADSKRYKDGRKIVESDGEKYMKERGRQDEVLVEVDIKKIDKSWKEDKSFYLPKDGKGESEIGGRREGFKEWREKNKDTPIESPSVVINNKGEISFNNGRHRFAVLRDSGKTKIYVTVNKKDADKVRKKYG